MRAVVAWLFRGKTPLVVEGGAWAIPIRTDYAGHVGVAVVNASLDAWDRVRLELAMEREVKGVRRLRGDGSWEEVGWRVDAGSGKLVIESEAEVGHADLAAFRIE
jgi:hypothetical protein